MYQPTPDDVRAARLSAGHTQAEAAELVGYHTRSWQKFEAGEKAMRPASFELYTILTRRTHKERKT